MKAPLCLFSIFAFIIPFPLFFDLSRGTFVIHPVEWNKIMVTAGIPVPIGLLGITLITLFSFFQRISRFYLNKKLVALLVCLSIFCFIEFGRVTPPRLFALALPILLFLTFSNAASQRDIAASISKGYLAGMATQISLHIASFCLFSYGYESMAAASRSFFGYEIYQALVSYSAVLSILGSALIFYFLIPRPMSGMWPALIYTVAVYFIVLSASRKAALVDLALVSLTNIFLMFRFTHLPHPASQPIKKKIAIHGIIFIILSSLVFLFVLASPRDLNVDSMLTQRGGNYKIFFAALPTLSWRAILTGHEAGWGGYSNLFVELFVRAGVLGTIAYLSSFILAVNFFYRALLAPARNAQILTNNDIHVTCWFIFALSSLCVSNIVNMNLLLPYYTVNFLLINTGFIFYYPKNGHLLTELPSE